MADMDNSRIQLWKMNAEQGAIVARSSNGNEDNGSASLRYPIGMFFDERSEVIYIADTSNHRITRWLPNAVVGELIPELSDQGNRSD